MVYLPPTSWWRFIGWLVLGMSIYTSYGYRHSALARRTGRDTRLTPGIEVVSLGFLTAAIGLFAMPHHMGIGKLLGTALAADAPQHARALLGVSLTSLGLLLGIVGSVRGARAGAGSSPSQGERP